MAKKHTLIPASNLIFKRGNKIALIRRYHTGFRDGDYDLISGHTEQGESFTATAIREGKEESDVIINSNDLELVHTMQRLQENGQKRIDTFFVVKKWSGELKNMEPKKCNDLHWFDENNLPRNMVPYVRKALQYISKRIHYSEYGYNKH